MYQWNLYIGLQEGMEWLVKSISEKKSGEQQSWLLNKDIFYILR
jgi:hypothetical protein